MSVIKQDPNHQSDMPTTEEGNVLNVNLDGLIKPSAVKSLDYVCKTAEYCDGLAKSASLEKSDDFSKPALVENSDGSTKPALLKKSDALKESADADGDVEAGEISSLKGSEEEEKPFSVECELDFEGESAEVSSKKVAGDGDDDGECTDEVDEDLEEGELKDEIPCPLESNANSKPNQPTKTVCRFYNRGSCFYGNNCRFLHVNFLKTGNYSMFAPARVGIADGFDPAPPIGSMPHGMINHRSGVPPPRSGLDFPPGPPLCSQASSAPALETAWERALRDAKEMVKKANKRKIEEPDFEEKRLNLSLVVNEKNIPEVENEIPYKKKKRDNSSFLKREYDAPHDIYNDVYESRPHSREGHFDNMEMRYQKDFRRGRTGRMGDHRDNYVSNKFPKSPDINKERFRDDRLQVPSRSRGDDYFDPWRRSKSPKGNVRRTRSRSGSYSSVSSYSYSSRSSRSSCSYSRSSSSSRSLHPHQKRTPSPSTVNPSFGSPKIGPNKFNLMKNKPGGRPRSLSRTPSRSRSRSFSRSISMDSVSSASSSISHSSHEPGHQNSHASILRKQENRPSAVGEKPVPTIVANPPTIPLPTAYLNYNPLNKDCKLEKTDETPKEPPSIVDEDDRDPLDEKFLTPASVDVPFPSLQHLLPTTNDTVKEPFKGTSQKQQIKLTLLNKTPKLNSLPKKELDVNKQQNDEPSKPEDFYPGVKGPLSPPPIPPVIAKPAPVLVPKKSASCRRDELLKQLKAVEDAIARKRAKFG